MLLKIIHISFSKGELNLPIIKTYYLLTLNMNLGKLMMVEFLSLMKFILQIPQGIFTRKDMMKDRINYYLKNNYQKNF